MNVALVTSPQLNHTAFLEALDHSQRETGRFDSKVQYAHNFVPMALLSLAGTQPEDINVDIFDINKEINLGRFQLDSSFYLQVTDWILECRPDLVGFMTDCDSYHHTLRLCKALKAANPLTLTLLGGPQATATHYETLLRFGEVDFVLRGEGEVAFKSLLESLYSARDINNVGNLSFREQSNIRITKDIPLISDLDNLPWPAFALYDIAPSDSIYLEIGRGCPFKCNFCFTAPYWKRKHRIKSPSRIIRELAYLKKSCGRTDFNFTHDLFTADRNWVISFCKQLIECDLHVTWTCSSRTDTLNKEMIDWLQRAGCRNIYFGIEAGTTEMQKAIVKDLDLDQAKKVIKETVDSGIHVTVGFIAGLPNESNESLRGTLEEAFRMLHLPKSTVHLFGFAPYRGSDHYEAIKPSLHYDENFLDFPLPEEQHALNCLMMKEHDSVFIRYSRFIAYNGIDVTVIRASEEFFPIQNALRELMVALHRKGLQPLELLINWSRWIHERNTCRGRSVYQRHHGSIKDFLEFLSDYLPTQSFWDVTIADYLRWETVKNTFRFATNTVDAYVSNLEPHKLYANPTVIVEDFFGNPFTDQELCKATKQMFAFYIRKDGELQILQLSSLARLILLIAREGVKESELVTAITDLQLESDRQMEETRESIYEMLKVLTMYDLLISVETGGEAAWACRTPQTGQDDSGHSGLS